MTRLYHYRFLFRMWFMDRSCCVGSIWTSHWRISKFSTMLTTSTTQWVYMHIDFKKYFIQSQDMQRSYTGKNCWLTQLLRFLKYAAATLLVGRTTFFVNVTIHIVFTRTRVVKLLTYLIKLSTILFSVWDAFWQNEPLWCNWFNQYKKVSQKEKLFFEVSNVTNWISNTK